MSRQDAPRLPRQATEPHRLKQQPWPRNLFGELASIEELMAEAASPTDADARGSDRRNMSRTLSNPSGFDVIWFWSDGCKSRWNRDRIRRQANVH
jgi:hypothetical protein